jgi:hypothetical protein
LHSQKFQDDRETNQTPTPPFGGGSYVLENLSQEGQAWSFSLWKKLPFREEQQFFAGKIEGVFSKT